MLQGQAKRDYQKKYMQNQRKNKVSVKTGQKGPLENARGLTTIDDVRPVRPLDPSVRPANYGLTDCQCKHCQQNRKAEHKLLINHGTYKSVEELGTNEVNRVSLPGDIDYVSSPAQSQVKCNSFDTLPKDVQQIIDRLSPADGSEGEGPPDLSREARISNAIHYQNTVLDSTGRPMQVNQFGAATMIKDVKLNGAWMQKISRTQ